MHPITLHLTEYEHKEKGFLTDNNIDIVLRNYNDIKNLGFHITHDFCLTHISFENFKYYAMGCDEVTCILKYFIEPHFKNKLKYPFYVYMLALNDTMYYREPTAPNRFSDVSYTVHDLVNWVDTRCMRISANVNEDLLRTVVKRRHQYVIDTIKSALPNRNDIIEYLDYVDLDRIESIHLFNTYHEIYLKDSAGYTHGALFKVYDNDNLFPIIDAHIEDLYA